MRAAIAKCYAGCDKTTLSMTVFSFVIIGLVINSVLLLRKHDWDNIIVNEVGPVLVSPRNGSSMDDVEYMRAYISADIFITREEWQPKTSQIDCANHTETVSAFYLYARRQEDGLYRASLTCIDTLRNNICPGQTYLDDPKLKSILNGVSPYLTQNVLTENDLRMASLALEFQNYRAQHPLKHSTNYEDPKVAYLVMSAQTPSYLHYAFDHIRNKTNNETIIYTTFDYNSRKADEFMHVMANHPDVTVLPTRWLANWGAISLVYLEVSAWLELLKMEGWDYLINISDTDGFIVPADEIQKRLKELNGRSYIECPFMVRNPDDQNKTCMASATSYRYTDVWLDCGASVRGIKHPSLAPNYPSYADFYIKASQWKVLSRSVIEKFVLSQDFWDILFSYRNSLVPDEHVFPNAAKRILPDEPFIYRTIHRKTDLVSEDYIDDQVVLDSIEKGYWFVRKVRQLSEWESVERVREEYFAKNDEREEDLQPVRRPL